MRQIFLPFAPWAPDDPAYSDGHQVRVSGVIPAAKGYRPFPSPVAEGGSLPEKPTGALSFIGPAGNITTVAGTATSLYQRDTSGWARRGQGYHGDHGWSFTVYGRTVIAANGVDATLAATAGAGMTFTAIPGAPKARAAAVVGNFVMLGNLSDNPEAVRWSAIDDPMSWPEPGSNEAQYKQSDIQVFPDVGPVVGIATGMAGYDGLVFCERGIARLQYIGPPYIFQSTMIDKNRGNIAAGSVVQAENVVYFLADDGFFATDGATVRNIGAEKIGAWWKDNVNYKRRDEVMGAYDPVNGVVAWAFPSVYGQTGIYDQMLIYRPALDAFSLVPCNLEFLYLDANRGLTLEDLDAYGPLDKLPFSLDSKGLMPNIRIISGFDDKHSTVTFSGDAMEASLETEEKGGGRMMVHAVRPLVDGTEARAAVLYRDRQAGDLKEKNCGGPSRIDGLCHTHISTRYARVSVVIPAGGRWKNALGVELYVEEEGGL